MGQAILGMRQDGRPALLDLTNPASQHINIRGARGSGKSELLRTIVASLTLRHGPRELGCAVIDPSDRELRVFEALPHSLGATPATAPEEFVAEQLDRTGEIVVTVDRAPQRWMRDWIDQLLSIDSRQVHLLVVGNWIDMPGARLQAHSMAMFEMDSGVRFQAAYLPAADLNLLVKLLRARWRRATVRQSLAIRLPVERVLQFGDL
jgi:energy-coupling factor transporter ATP-binding protein EcfA2